MVYWNSKVFKFGRSVNYVFIEVDTSGTKDASVGFERFTRRYEDRERIDYRVKLVVTEHYLGDRDSIVTDCGDTMSKEEFMEKVEYYREFTGR